MFAQRLAGRSVAGIARELTERGVPCPSVVDPQFVRWSASAAAHATACGDLGACAVPC
jgi:hypothetical protein